MGNVMFQMAVSLDGFVAGPDQSEEDPIGVGGTAVFGWWFELEMWRRQQGLEGGVVNASTAVMEEGKYLSAGLVDEFELHVVPVLLGAGERLLENVGNLRFEQVRAIEAPGVTHIKYQVVR